MNLKDLQNAFKDDLLECEDPSKSCLPGVGIYRKGCRTGLLNSLRRKYPITFLYVRQPDFFRSCEQYVQKNPLKNPSLALYGEDFYLCLSCPVAQALAQLEWLMHKALIQYKPEAAFPLENLVMPGISFFTVPSFRLRCNVYVFKSDYNLKEIWSCLTKKENPPIKNQKTYLLVTTEGPRSFFMDIKEKDYQYLLALKMGFSLSQILHTMPQESLQQTIYRFVDFYTKD